MNNARRKEISSIIEQVEELKDKLENILADEDEYRDNMPENLWGSERYEKSEEASQNLELAISSLEEVIDYLEENIQEEDLK